MIALLIVILIMSVVSSICCFTCWINCNKKNETIIKNEKAITELYKEFSELKNEILILQNNPAEFTKKVSMIDFRLNKMEDILSTFNNGFKYQESWMR